MTPKPLKRGATYDDLCDVPDNFVAEMFDGELYATPRPSLPHARAAAMLGVELGGPFDRGRNGPGGWVILDEPELGPVPCGTPQVRQSPHEVVEEHDAEA